MAILEAGGAVVAVLGEAEAGLLRGAVGEVAGAGVGMTEVAGEGGAGPASVRPAAAEVAGGTQMMVGAGAGGVRQRAKVRGSRCRPSRHSIRQQEVQGRTGMRLRCSHQVVSVAMCLWL